MIQVNAETIIRGKLFRSIVLYCLPVILIGLIQNLFNAVDLMVLGIMADDRAIAAVGAPVSLIGLLQNTFFGFSSGAKVVLARLIGAEQALKTKRTISTSLILGLILGILTTVVGIVFVPTFLRITNCPAECMADAILYARIYLLAAPAIMLYNYGSAILAASGDSQRPLYYMLVSGCMNVVLNFAFCLILPQKVAAVAISTAISQLVGAVLVCLRLTKMEGICRVRLKHMRWSWISFRQLIVNGLPIGLSSALYPLANLQIQPQTNSFGTAVMAGNSAMGSIEGLVGSIASSPWASTTTVFVGQNLGAGKPDRVRKSIVYSLGIVITLGLILGILGTVFSRFLISFYVTEEAAIAAAQTRMVYTLLPYAVCAVNGVLSHVIQAFGYSFFCTANSIVSVLLFRVFWMHLIYPQTPTFDMLCRCYLVSWCLMLVINVTFTLYLYRGKFKKGRLKKML